jgi:hypothetical protein
MEVFSVSPRWERPIEHLWIWPESGLLIATDGICRRGLAGGHSGLMMWRTKTAIEPLNLGKQEPIEK